MILLQTVNIIASLTCSRFYLDFGTNVGWQINRLYNSTCISPVSSLFEEVFGSRRDDVCAIGFEPNPRHAGVLQRIEQHHAANGRFVTINIGFAGTRDGMEWLHTNKLHMNGATHHDWTAGRVSKHDNNHRLRTKEFNVSRILLSLPANAIIVAKMDVEGDERSLVPELIRTGALCRIHTLYYEFHDGYELPVHPCHATRFVAIDDESECEL